MNLTERLRLTIGQISLSTVMAVAPGCILDEQVLLAVFLMSKDGQVAEQGLKLLMSAPNREEWSSTPHTCPRRAHQARQMTIAGVSKSPQTPSRTRIYQAPITIFQARTRIHESLPPLQERIILAAQTSPTLSARHCRPPEPKMKAGARNDTGALPCASERMAMSALST